MAEPQLDEQPVSTPGHRSGLSAVSFVRRSVSRSRGSLLAQTHQNLLARQVDPKAVLNLLTNGCSIPAEDINEAITVAAKTSNSTCVELIALADPSMLSEAVRRLTIDVFAANGLWDELLAAFVELGARKQQADAASIVHVLNALLSLSREHEALATYDQLTGDQLTGPPSSPVTRSIIEELSTSSGTASTASPERSTPSGKVVPQHGQSGRLAVTRLGSRATSGRAWWL